MQILEKIEEYFYKRYLERVVIKYLEFHLDRVKKPFLKQFKIHLSKETHIKDVSAFVMLDEKPKRMVYQIPTFKKIAHSHSMNILNDNVIDAIKHEFAHLKYRKEGKKHLAWMNKQKLFKK